MKPGSTFRFLVITVLSPLLGSCVSIETQRMAERLSDTVLNQSDPELVRSGAPAYLLLVDSMIVERPNDRRLLNTAARMYGAYASGLVEEPERKRKLCQQAMDYASRSFCPRNLKICESRTQPYRVFSDATRQLQASDPEALFVYAASWAGWIEANRGNWNAVADLPKVELLFQHLVDANPGYAGGKAQFYLAIMRTVLPASMGGNPEKGREHFEKAISFSAGKDLIFKVAYAERYARLVYDKALHDRLLSEVLSADPKQPGLTLSNVIAQQRARSLLSENYF